MGLWKSVRYQPFILDLLVGNMLELLRGSECDVWHSAVRGSVDLLTLQWCSSTHDAQCQ